MSSASLSVVKVCIWSKMPPTAPGLLLYPLACSRMVSALRPAVMMRGIGYTTVYQRPRRLRVQRLSGEGFVGLVRLERLQVEDAPEVVVAGVVARVQQPHERLSRRVDAQTVLEVAVVPRIRAVEVGVGARVGGHALEGVSGLGGGVGDADGVHHAHARRL